MKIPGPLLPARFVERPNRFLTRVEIDGTVVDSHLPDPGRLQELLLPGAELLVRPVPKNQPRKTRYSTVMVKKNDQWISLVSALPNRFVSEALRDDLLPQFHGYSLVQPEITVGSHRFDFLLENNSNIRLYLEVKSVTYVENRIAQFPDAVSARATRHARALADLVKKGNDAGILFVCQRPDADEFRPLWDRDPMFSQTLLDTVEQGVRCWCITLQVSPKEMTYFREIPVNLTPRCTPQSRRKNKDD